MIIKNRSDQVITSVADWLTYAPPKDGVNQWKDYRSAKELAKAWFRPSVPAELQALFRTRQEFNDFVVHEAIPEYTIRLDDFGGESRNADMLLVGRTADGPALVTIEAKADEGFADLVGEHYDKHLGTRSNIPNRIDRLIRAMFGRGLDDGVRRLRYQLLHSAAATLIEAEAQGATRAAFVVYEFLSAHNRANKVAGNAGDWAHFISLLGLAAENCQAPGRLLGPVAASGGEHVPAGIPLFVGKVSVTLP